MGDERNDAALDFDAAWDYNDPAGTRERFEALRIQLQGDDGSQRTNRLQLMTQIARTHGLEGDFDAAHALLDEVEGQLGSLSTIEGVRYLLERGRVFRSSGEIDKALPLFEQAFDIGVPISADYHAIDAAHMMAIVVDSTEARRAWSYKGIEIAEASDQQRVRHWLGSIYNNLGWDYHGDGQFDEALEVFQKALAARQQEGEAKSIAVARWCVARCLRSVGQVTQALAIQQQLQADHIKAGTSDGYVSEELAELHLALGHSAESARYFGEAHRLLSQDKWLVANEGERLERLLKLSESSPQP